MRAFTSFAGLLSASLAIAAPSSNIEVVERMRSVPTGWTQLEAPQASHLLHFRLAVKQERAAEFEQMVLDMSSPDHETYGKHMSKTELKEFLKPRSEVSETIMDWLAAEDVPEANIEDDGDWVNFIVPVSQAEKMMHTKFYYYYNHQTKKNSIRTLEYSLPADVAEVTQMIQPTTRFGQPRPQSNMIFEIVDVEGATIPTGYDPTYCNTTITPGCIRGLYNLGNFTANPNVSNSIGISGYLEEYARFDDTENFIEELFPAASGFNFSWVSINGGLLDQNSASDSTEANLDVQYALTTSYNTKMVYYSTAGRGVLIPDNDQPTADDDGNEPYLDQLHYLLSLSDDELPKVLSTSYGEDEQSVPAEYTNSTCSLFAQLGSRGVSVLFSSGDTGVGQACETNDGTNTTRFLPIFPAACPFVTSVGGTYQVEPEIAVSFSSGGFSDRFKRPSYQEDAVSAYLDILGDKWEGLYNPAGRGFPDVAAQGYNYYVYNQGVVSSVSGTSCSAPTFAGIVASLNSILLGQGKPTLGFLNPWIYSTAYTALNDIVGGGSNGCTGTDSYSGLQVPYVPYASWNATPGWDPVTGHGTPDFGKLSALLTASY